MLLSTIITNNNYVDKNVRERFFLSSSTAMMESWAASYSNPCYLLTRHCGKTWALLITNEEPVEVTVTGLPDTEKAR